MLLNCNKRPAFVEDRAVPGHWEGDLLSGSKNSYIKTLVLSQMSETAEHWHGLIFLRFISDFCNLFLETDSLQLCSIATMQKMKPTNKVQFWISKPRTLQSQQRPLCLRARDCCLKLVTAGKRTGRLGPLWREQLSPKTREDGLSRSARPSSRLENIRYTKGVTS